MNFKYLLAAFLIIGANDQLVKKINSFDLKLSWEVYYHNDPFLIDINSSSMYFFSLRKDLTTHNGYVLFDNRYSEIRNYVENLYDLNLH